MLFLDFWGIFKKGPIADLSSAKPTSSIFAYEHGALL